MQLSTIFFTVLLSTTVVAKGNKTTKAVTDKSLCRDMAKLEKTVALAANTTKLAAKEKNNATKIAEFQAKASTAATDLATMQTNATLVTTCAVFSAAEATEDDCEKMTKLQKMIDLAANSTKLAEKAKNNATKIASLEAKASAASVKLADMSSNTTLTDTCATIKSAKAQAKAAKANSTTSDASKAEAATANSASASSTSTTSGASMLNTQTGVLSTMLLVAVGMFML